MVTLHLAVLNQNKFRTTPPAHSPAGQRWGHLRGTPGRLPGTHTRMQGRTDEQKHAKSVASGGRPERPPRPLARPHAAPAGRHRHPNHAPNAPDGGDARGAAPAPASPPQARPTALPGPPPDDPPGRAPADASPPPAHRLPRGLRAAAGRPVVPAVAAVAAAAVAAPAEARKG